MSENTRKYLYLGLLAGAAVLLIAGGVVLGMAVSFEGYVTALMLWALAGCGVVGAREFKQWRPHVRTPSFAPSPRTEPDGQSVPSQEHPSATDGR